MAGTIIFSTVLPGLLTASYAASGSTIPANGFEPWLKTQAYRANELSRLADIEHLPLTRASLVKSFDPGNDADAFVVPTPTVRWVCQRDSCARIFDVDTTLRSAATKSGTPLSAKLAVAADESTAIPSLCNWLSDFESTSGRRYIDADAYLTTSAGASSASLGWHIDDIVR